MPTNTVQPGYAFILNPLEVEIDLNQEIVSGCRLAKATSMQTAIIKRLVSPYGGQQFDWCYESELMPHLSANQTIHRQGVAPDRWRYWVINHDATVENVPNLARAFGLIEPSIEVGPHIATDPVSGGESGYMIRPTSVFAFYHAWNHGDKPILLNERMCQDARSVFRQLEDLERNSAHPEIVKAIADCEYTDSLPRNSSFRALALFAVLESIITHYTQAEYDSITHQTATKMALLGKRFSHPLDYSSFQDVQEAEKLWKKLYAYRSAVAHGSQPDFEGKLHMLKDEKTVMAFMRTAVRRLLRHYLDDPEFIHDLKRC